MSNIIPFRSGLLHEQNSISSYPPIDVLADSQSVLLRASAKSAFGVLADQLEAHLARLAGVDLPAGSATALRKRAIALHDGLQRRPLARHAEAAAATG